MNSHTATRSAPPQHAQDRGAGAPQAEPWPTSRRPDVPVRLWLRIARIFQKIEQATAAELRREGLTVGQFDVLVQVGSAEGSTQQQVADALLVTKSNVCQLLDRMERAGLVERRQHGRMNHLYLTEDGQRLYQRVVPAHEQRIAEHLASLSPDEQRTALGLLRRVDQSLA
jgi:DNA-binding MarR family transcriptional regulator